MKTYYFNTDPKNFGIKTKLHKTIFGHKIYKETKLLFVTPVSVDKKNLSPKNIRLLKEKYKIKKVVMFDRVLGSKKNILIFDHVNRSGISFLVGKTPHKEQPMFPDMSGIYIIKTNEKGRVVQTLGPKRFSVSKNEKGVVFSEAAGIIAPLWHYVGVRVRCYGVCNQKNRKHLITI